MPSKFEGRALSINMARWQDLPLELRLYVLGFLRFPYLLILLAVPGFGDLARFNGYELLEKAHRRLALEKNEYDDLLECEHQQANGLLSSYYDGVVRLSYSFALAGWRCTLASRDHIYHWIFGACLRNRFRILYSMHRYQGRLVSVYYRDDLILLLTTYDSEGCVAAITYYCRLAFHDGAVLLTRARLKAEGNITGTWEAQLRREGCPIKVASRLYGAECVTTYYQGLELALSSLRQVFVLPEAFLPLRVPCLVPSAPLLFAKAAEPRRKLPLIYLDEALKCASIRNAWLACHSPS